LKASSASGEQTIALVLFTGIAAVRVATPVVISPERPAGADHCS
jgi:hypothetical protein